MKRFSLLLPFLLALGLDLVPSTLEAQKTYALGLAGGPAIPVGKLADTQKTGIDGLVALAVGVPDIPIGFRLDAMYNRLPAPDRAGPASASSGSGNFRIAAGIANLIYTFSGTTAKPYLIAGAGVYNTLAEGDAKSLNSLGFNGGVGVTIGVGPLALFIESRYHSISRKPEKGGVIQFVPITLGLMF